MSQKIENLLTNYLKLKVGDKIGAMHMQRLHETLADYRAGKITLEQAIDIVDDPILTTESADNQKNS